jgi:N-acetylneuraminic acid mutarotase
MSLFDMSHRRPLATSHLEVSSLVLVLSILLVTGCGGGSKSATEPPPPLKALEWAWISGSSSLNAAPFYGTQGVSSATNAPGARTNAVSWIDSAGNLWLFGGIGIDSAGNSGDLNDLWKYNPNANTWAWISGSKISNASGIYGTQGTSSSDNIPGARTGAVSWTDMDGNFWLFGGTGVDSQGDSGLLSDLWEYHSGSNTWVWIDGSSVRDAAGIYGTKGSPATNNAPGARTGAVSWTDSAGNLWLFGGTGFDSQNSSDLLNDLWKYNPTNKTWAWISGSSVRDAVGVYGTKGNPSSSNVPGARNLVVAWIDSTGDLWLFGGYGIDLVGTTGDLNDLWKYNPSTNSWSWVSGLNLVNSNVAYGTKGTPSASNFPGARQEAVTWVDADGNFWLFGGVGNALAGSSGDLNDLWEYSPTANTWTWISGSNEADARSVYGSKDTNSPTITPGGRQDAIAWIDSSDALWLFGGYGLDAFGNTGNHNDLWKFPLK